MAMDYTTGQGFEPKTSAVSAATTASNLTAIAWNKLLHRQVMNASFWKGMIGSDKSEFGEGTTSNFPIVEKTDLKKSSGDSIRIGLVKKLHSGDTTTHTFMNYGFTGTSQMVDNETAMVQYYLSVPVALYRDATLIDGEMAEIRSPFDLQKVGKDLCAEAATEALDNGIFAAFYGRFSPNIWRQNSLTGVAHTNNVYGKNKSALTSVDASDIVDSDLLERMLVFAQTQNINPVVVDGQECFGLAVHPYGLKTLFADSNYRDAVHLALPRSTQNPIFKRAGGQMYAGIFVLPTNKVSTPKNYAVAATSDAIASLSAPTVGDGVTATDLRMNIFFGANAIARAWAKETFMRRRQEDDYGNLKGFGFGYVQGDVRADWKPDTSATTTGINQSSAIVYTHSPNPNSNISDIWS